MTDVLVSRDFIRGFNSLKHNYALTAVAPDHYWGNERSAYSDAFARCGKDLAELAELLPETLSTAASLADAQAEIARLRGALEVCRGYAIEFPDSLLRDNLLDTAAEALK